MPGNKDMTANKKSADASGRDELTAEKMKSTKAEISDNLSREASVPKLAHEFRTRLSVIKGAIDNVTDGVFGEIAPEQRKSLLIAAEGVERMRELVEDLMASLAPGHAAMRLNRESAELADIVKHATGSMQSIAYREGIRLDARMPKKSIVVFCDPVKIEQVLLNLLRNSIKFTSRGGKVTVTVTADPEQAAVNVRDDGVGIPPEKLSTLFAELDVRKLKTKDGGYRTSGLGLIIVKEILDAHGSDITVKSEIGKGTTTSFTLPVIKKQK